MNEICGDNRFEIIAKAKAHLLDATNIDTSEDEMKVLDSFLFRCWQMGWLDRYDTADRKTEPTHDLRTETHECVKDTHDKTEPTISKMEQVDKDINVRSKYEPKICDTCRYYNSNIPCGSTPSACKEADKFAEEFVDALKKLKPKDEPTISKMEQVEEPQYDFGEYADRLWKIAYERGKREALEQTEPSCDTCKLKDTTEWCKRQEVCRAYQPKDEPQTCEECEHWSDTEDGCADRHGCTITDCSWK